MPIATVGDAQTEHGGLFTNVKKERLNHLRSRLALYWKEFCWPLSVRKRRTGAQDLLQQRTDHTILVAPFRLHIIADAIRLRLKELALILGFPIDPVQRDDREGFIQQTRILVLGRTNRQRKQLVSKSERGGVLGG